MFLTFIMYSGQYISKNINKTQQYLDKLHEKYNYTKFSYFLFYFIFFVNIAFLRILNNINFIFSESLHKER